jgi:hypothetical protein
MVSDASPGAADPKMIEPFVHMDRASSHRAFAQDGYFKRPHSNIIDGDMWSESGWFLGDFGWFWGCGTSDTRLARRKLRKNNTPQPWRPPSPYDLHGAPPRRRRIRQSANMLRNKSMSLKLENIIVFTIY